MVIELGKEESVGIKISTAERYPSWEYSDENLFWTFTFLTTVRPRRTISFHNLLLVCFWLVGAFLRTDIEVYGP